MKSSVHDIYVKSFSDVCDIRRFIKHKSDDKKKKGADDIMTYVALLERHKISNVKFVALNLLRVPQLILQGLTCASC